MAEMRGEASAKIYRNHVAPYNGIPITKETKQQWVTAADGKVTCMGVLGSVTGRPCTGLCVMDDTIRGEADAASPTIRDKIWAAYIADIKSRMHPTSMQVVVATRWHEDDLSGRLMQTEPGQWDYLNLPAMATADPADPDPLGREPGQGLWLEHFPQNHYEDTKQTLINSGLGFLWDTLHQGDPIGDWTKSEWPASYFRDHIWYDTLPPEVADGSAVKLSLVVCDPSKGAHDGCDNTAIMYVLLDRNMHIWVHDAVVRRIPMDKIEDNCVAMYDRHKDDQGRPHYIIVEDVGYQKFILDNIKKACLREGRSIPLRTFPVDYSKKEVRIRFALSKLFAQQRIHLNRAVPNLNVLVSEAKQFPTGRNDDAVDCLAAAASSFHALLKKS